MKKIGISLLICSLIIIFISVFYFEGKKNTSMVNNKIDEVSHEEERKDDKENIYTDDNKIILGLYKNYHDGRERKLIREYLASWSYHNDISSFEVYYTNEEAISSKNQIALFSSYKDMYDQDLKYRIGYFLSFETTLGVINKTVLKPVDTKDFFNYLEIYLYDDYHQNGGWYSHVTEEEFNENTLLTSIKLTAGLEVEKIISDITLTAFTYDSDDFDEEGNYRGISKYTIIVKNNNN